MAQSRGSAAYKKQDGILEIARNDSVVTWTAVAPPGSRPALTLPISIITSMTPMSAGADPLLMSRQIFSRPPQTTRR